MDVPDFMRRRVPSFTDPIEGSAVGDFLLDSETETYVNPNSHISRRSVLIGVNR